MTQPKYTKAYRGERLDVDDVSNMSEMSQRDGLAQVGEQALVGTDAPATVYVLYGLKCSGTPGDSAITVSPGALLGNFTDAGAHGTGVIAESPIVESVPITGLAAAANYVVYAQIQYTDALPGNRGHWNEVAAGSAVEYARNVPTRRTAIAVYRLAASSPGTDWTALATFSTLAGVLAAAPALTPTRNFFWEGREGGSPAYSALLDWGTTNDRNADRGTYGVRGLKRFVDGTRAQIMRLISSTGTNWAATISKGVDEMLARDGSRTVIGDLTPDGSPRSLGTLPLPWTNVFASQFTAYMTNGYKYTGAATIYWRAKAHEAIVEPAGDLTRGLDDATPSTALITGSASPTFAMWPLRLPDGATIQNLLIEHATVTGGVSFSIFRETQGANTTHNLRTGGYVTIAAGGPGDTTITGFDSGQVVDNSQYFYYVVLKATAVTTILFTRLSVQATTLQNSPD
jgi:hypothetical protein